MSDCSDHETMSVMKKYSWKLVLLLFGLPVWVCGQNPVKKLESQLKRFPFEQIDEADLAFCRRSVSKQQAEDAAVMIYDAYAESIRKRFETCWLTKRFVYKTFSMPFEYFVYGEKPTDGRSLYLSMHGGGGAPASVNNQQWENQKRLYRPVEGVYLAPRAAVDAWNMWHQEHVDRLFEEMIRTAVVLLDVDPDKVYVMGYSAGGDGTFQLAPRLADHWAAAAMMAGHPGDARPDNLRNIGFSLWMGENDGAYDRNKHAVEWKKLLDSCRQDDPAGYDHEVHILADKGHWMERQDTLALNYLSQFVRNPYPEKVVWCQDDVVRPSFYWLSIPVHSAKAGDRAVVSYRGNTITVLQNDYAELTIWLSDRMIDLDRPVEIRYREKQLFFGKISRTIGSLLRSMKERGDRRYLFPAFITISGETVVDRS